MIQLTEGTARFLYSVLMHMSLQVSADDFEAVAAGAVAAKRELLAALTPAQDEAPS